MFLKTPPVRSASGLLGVVYRKDIGAWQASITALGMQVHLGIHASKEQAYAAYLSAKRSMHAGCTI